MAKHVKYVSSHGMEHAATTDVEGLRWRNGEIKEVTDAQACELFTNRDFIDADLGYNPNFRCASCDETTYNEGVLQRDGYKLLRNTEGRVCLDCFEGRVPAVEAPPVSPAEVQEPEDEPEDHEEEV